MYHERLPRAKRLTVGHCGKSARASGRLSTARARRVQAAEEAACVEAALREVRRQTPPEVLVRTVEIST